MQRIEQLKVVSCMKLVGFLGVTNTEHSLQALNFRFSGPAATRACPQRCFAQVDNTDLCATLVTAPTAQTEHVDTCT